MMRAALHQLGTVRADSSANVLQLNPITTGIVGTVSSLAGGIVSFCQFAGPILGVLTGILSVATAFYTLLLVRRNYRTGGVPQQRRRRR